RDYWQKRPLLIRGAFPEYAAAGLVPPITPEDLAGLACEDTALSRLVRFARETDAWSVQHGPFAEDVFLALPDHDWTLLVQDVDKWDADVNALLSHFDFLPRWRLDDVMVSFAAPGGSVGAHVDQYDVFLLQAQGHREWHIDARAGSGDQTFRDDTELKLLRDFAPTHAWTLEPGDMLYLPPGIAHHGIAVDACLTFSIGMRAPAAAELLGDYVDTLTADMDERLRYADPDLASAGDPGKIDAAALARVSQALDALHVRDPDFVGDWFGRFITTYRSAAQVQAPPAPPSRIELEWALNNGAALARNPWSRSAWRRAARGARLYVAGEPYPMPVADARRLAALPAIDGRTYAALSPAGRDAVYALTIGGHLALFDDEDLATKVE
ncbi:MAG TPA: cupin domain-containing protein, partial [Xanthomonadaceae bacterium]|nr:cupin domain-containing protein [Xanthomonadaceae bacterium]